MPELPEVETVRRSLAPFVKNKNIVNVKVTDQYVLRGQALEAFRNGLIGQEFKQSDRHGKLLFFPLQDRTLIVHLGMTGQLTIRLPDREDTEFIRHEKTGLQRTLQHAPDKHTHIQIELENGACLLYRDVRKFGRFFWIPKTNRDEIVQHFRLGVDPLTDLFNSDYLYEGLKKRRTPIKSALLNQNFLAGLGNIYVDEALFHSEIRPGRASNRLSRAKSQDLTEAITMVLDKGIDAGGTTLKDFVNGQGQGGYNQEGLQVYGKYGQPCPKCEQVLKRGTYGGRTTSWCSSCQK